ncbi:LamG domain-containing protein [Alteromonas sp. 1_MG-2023]|uniref:LamG domain-containing protein n=1 Tax=Alteromonas sp. 1_MG-2023 TaxID=3062669 RepID=UPI0026E4232F|nr:LamG domain-containing protein [Alteromonas sp. 1_MG-2023]MDO6565557.1 LamG domain-containing protein [Alteromonas sp. 1_MG-2023]
MPQANVRKLQWRNIVATMLTVLLAACGGSETQVETNPLPPATEQPVVNYTGPAASTDDVANFKRALWDNIATTDRCGACHTQGAQSPTFARNDDINLAYADTGTLVNLSQPSESLLVTKVAGGHNCWLTSDTACADILTTWISDWASESEQQNQATEIELQAPTTKSPGSTKNFPESAALFESTVYPLLENFCASCHTNSATIPISPFFSSSDIDEAYEAAKDRMNLTTPSDSRFVVRLRDEFHNCWSNCDQDGESLEDAIAAMAEGIETTELDESLVNSNAVSLFDGTLASGGGRFEQNTIAKWEFKAGTGNTAFDTSGVDPALDLTLSGSYDWVGGYGIQLAEGKAQGSTTNSKKLYDLILGSGEFAIEAWVAPANVTQEGPARIVSYSGGKDRRNFTLGQTLYNYDMLLRTGNTDINGEPALSTDDADEVLQAALQHVVVNYDANNRRRIYVNGELAKDGDNVEGTNLTDWDDSFAFVLGSEVSGEAPWAGTIRMVAIHNRTLSDDEILTNFDAGVGQQYYLLFGVSELIDVPQSYIVFEVSQYDSYSYLFAEPFFISLDSSAQIPDISLAGMRIGLNGRESSSGQVFSTLNTQISDTNYDAQSGIALSRQGTIIPLEKGPELDEFFLTFEVLGDNQNIVVEALPASPAESSDLEPQSDIGTKHFAEINATMSVLTTVPMNTPTINDTFIQLKQQLPSVTDISSFLASNQMGITQLAIRYCDTLVETDSLRNAYFPDFDFTLPASSAYEGDARDGVLTPIISNMLLSNIDSQADETAVRGELNLLIDRLTLCGAGSSCDTQYTKTIAKASCAAVLGSATMLIQ